jgi:hypothetical protein
MCILASIAVSATETKFIIVSLYHNKSGIITVRRESG